MFKYILLILCISVVGCLTQRQNQKSKVMVQNVYGEVISWNKFPVVFTFHKDFPADKRIIVKAEITKFNKLVGQEIFQISNQLILGSQSTNKNKPNGINTIYWDFNQAFNMNHSEQGKTSVFWKGTEIYEFDINIQASMVNGYDFATLIRHELFHSLGVKHIDNTLMNPYLPEATVREWDLGLIQDWKQDLTTYAHVQFTAQTTSADLASKKQSN